VSGVIPKEYVVSDEVDVPSPHVRPVSPINASNAAEMAHRKAEKERARRTESQRQARVRATQLGDAARIADDASFNTLLDKKSNEELAELAIRKYAKIVLMGGEAFAPTTLREATEAAVGWANIAYKEAQKKRGLPAADEKELTPAEEAARSLRQFKSKMRADEKRTG
jgi:hypothetical protein